MIEIKFVSFQDAKELAAKNRNCASWEQLVRITNPHIVSVAEQEAADLYCEMKVKNLAQPDVIREVCKCESDYLQCNEFGKCPKCGKDWV